MKTLEEEVDIIYAKHSFMIKPSPCFFWDKGDAKCDHIGSFSRTEFDDDSFASYIKELDALLLSRQVEALTSPAEYVRVYSEILYKNDISSKV